MHLVTISVQRKKDCCHCIVHTLIFCKRDAHVFFCMSKCQKDTLLRGTFNITLSNPLGESQTQLDTAAKKKEIYLVSVTTCVIASTEVHRIVIVHSIVCGRCGF